MKHSFNQARSQGFTIVELLIVIIVIGILAAITIISYTGVTQQARDKSVLSDLDGVTNEVTRYAVKHTGQYGPAIQWNSSSGATNPNIQFVPTSGNIVNIAASSTAYCIRIFNPTTKYKDSASAAKSESVPGACAGLPAS